MRTLALFVPAFLSWTFLLGQGKLTLTVRGINEIEGSMMVALFDNENDFLKNPYQGKIVEVLDDSVEIVFTDLKPGRVGVSIIHDRNNNGKLDKNLFGIPTEGIGFGNNAAGILGPPSFEKASVVIGEGAACHVVDLKYY